MYSASQVIVVGGGLAGLSAAHTILEKGGRCLLLEKNPFCGGNSTKATSGINGALTRTQIRLGIPDSVDLFEEDTAKSAFKGDPKWQYYDLGKVLTHESAPAVEWLINRFGLDLSLVSRLGGHSQPRTHRGKEKFPGMTITYALMEKFEEIEKQTQGSKAKLITKAKVTTLIKDPTGAVIGCNYEKDGKTFSEYGPVIIATGGYAADFSQNSLLMKYRPDLLKLPTTNGEHCTGDGIKMSQAIGADVVDMEYVQVHPTGLVHPKDPESKVKFLAAEALRGVGGIMLDAKGNRFCDELGRRDYVSGEMAKNIAPFRLVLNSKASKEIEWHCKHYCGRGLMRFFKNGNELAKDMGITTDKLEETFRVYNKQAAERKDPYGKKFFHNLPLDINDSFNVSIITPVVHYCMGGLKISPAAEVMTGNKAIPGLYATGEVCGGVHGKNRLGGNSLLDCVVYGRVSGSTASAFLFSQTLKVIQSLEQSGQIKRITNIAGQMATPTGSVSQQSAPMQQGTSVTATGSKSYTVEDVAKHNTEHDCWVILYEKVYNVTKFMAEHPGGKDAIMLFAGQDATEQFDMLHQKSVIDKFGGDLYVGELRK